MMSACLTPLAWRSADLIDLFNYSDATSKAKGKGRKRAKVKDTDHFEVQMGEFQRAMKVWQQVKHGSAPLIYFNSSSPQLVIELPRGSRAHTRAHSSFGLCPPGTSWVRGTHQRLAKRVRQDGH